MHKYALYSFAADALAKAVAPLRANRVRAAALDAGWFNPAQIERAEHHVIIPSGDEDRDGDLFVQLTAALGDGASVAMADDTKHEAVKALTADAKPRRPVAEAEVPATKGPKGKAAKPDPDAKPSNEGDAS